jgi:hypothetical protein
MDHLHSMLHGNLDDLVACQICSHRRVLSAFPDNIGFIGFCSGNYDQQSYFICEILRSLLTLPVHAESILIAGKQLARPPSSPHFEVLPENCDSLQRKLVGLIASQCLQKTTFNWLVGF